MDLSESVVRTDVAAAPTEATVADILRAAAADAPDTVAVVSGTPSDQGPRLRWTYAELLAEAEAGARALAADFETGERMVIWGPSSPHWELLELSAALAGIVIVTANPALTGPEIEYVLDQSQASGIFHAAEFRGRALGEVVAEIRPSLPNLREVRVIEDWQPGPAFAELPTVQPGDACMIQYTSGTTGFPKGAVLTHRNVTNISRLLVERLAAERGSVWVNPLPMFHVGGCVLTTLGAIWLRATHCPVTEFHPATMLELIEQERGTVVPAVPTMLIHLLDHPDRANRVLTSLRRILSGGTTVPAELVRRIRSELGVEYCVMWGLTESSSVATQTLPGDSDDDLADTVGSPLPGVEVKVVDTESGAVTPIGVDGELCVRGVGVMREYFRMPDATEQALDGDGWLHTGDLGSMDRRGYCKVTGRLKDMIIRGGENIYPREIEEVLYTHPGVAEAAVVGAPDPVWGEVPAAFVRTADGAEPTPEDLMAHLRDHLASHKVPRVWRFVEALPMTPSGKIRKVELRAALAEVPQ